METIIRNKKKIMSSDSRDFNKTKTNFVSWKGGQLKRPYLKPDEEKNLDMQIRTK